MTSVYFTLAVTTLALFSALVASDNGNNSVTDIPDNSTAITTTLTTSTKKHRRPKTCYHCSYTRSDEDTACVDRPGLFKGISTVPCELQYCTSSVEFIRGKVVSVSRNCEDLSRGNFCNTNGQSKSCVVSCTTSYCNGGDGIPQEVTSIDFDFTKCQGLNPRERDACLKRVKGENASDRELERKCNKHKHEIMRERCFNKAYGRTVPPIRKIKTAWGTKLVYATNSNTGVRPYFILVVVISAFILHSFFIF
ncbi:uncharacterized protein LOC106153332 [Lingula anatina]|uniref:Uncharacterized protein LOC106153332 n=1 Tax=Lingula anatina TaxID=7574 RepID=A0A1S3H9J2_LINAN|nr:uncharacterized protein LOC106153332 [Lingula anatina]|eukprot:XP_013382672.1 uncharacterized protein LOC106153332 [Lingula anatina]